MTTDLSKPWQGSPPTAFKPKKPFMPRLVRSNKPDHVIGPGALLQGRLEFKGLLRVEGRFEGVLRPVDGANIIVARSGTVVGDVEGCHSVMVEGTIIGSVSASVVDLRRHAYIEGNVWCKDLAAAATAVFRNRAAVTPALSASSSSSQSHRRSSSASSDQGGEGVSGLGRSSRNNSISGGSGSSKGANGTAANTSPGCSGHRTWASSPPLPFGSSATTAPPSASNGSSGRADAASAAAATAEYSQPPRKPDAAAAAAGTAFPANGGARGGCPFPGHAASSAAAGKIFSSEAAAGMTAAQPPPLAATSSSSLRSLYGTKGKDGVVPDSRGGSTGGAAQESSPASSAPLLKSKPTTASPPPETPPPPSSRRGSRSSNGSAGSSGGGGSGGLVVGNGSAYTTAAMESPPRTHRRAGQVGNMTPDPRAMPSAVAAVHPGSGVVGGAAGARGSGRRSATGRGGGCPLPEDIQKATEQEQRKMGLDKVASQDGGGADAGAGAGAASGQKDPWRDCAKDYGVKTPSLTRSFASVAMVLSFDSYTGFEEHLQMEYAAENLWFWKQGMHFRTSSYASPQKRRDEARRIYDAFLSVDAPDQVNISHEDRENVLAALEVRPGAQAVGAGLFDEALIQVENMLALGPFPRFAGTMVKNIETSWRKVVEGFGVEDTGESFYSMLFEIAPPVEGLFTRSKRVQGEMLMSMVDSAVRLLNNLEELVPVLIQLGLRHNAYKVRKEHFPVVEDALMATLGLVLQKDFTEEIKQSWLAAYKLMANIMISVLEPPLEEEATAVESMVETSSISCSSSLHGSSPLTPPRKGKGGPGLAAAGAGDEGSNSAAVMDTPSINAVNSNNGSRRGSLRSAGASNGGGSIRGIYRRGTLSFRNQFSKLVRKESSTALGQPSASSPTAAAEPQSSPSAAAAAAAAATTAVTSVSSSLSSSTAAEAEPAPAPAGARGGSGGTAGLPKDSAIDGGVLDLVAAASLGAATSKTMENLKAATAAAAAASAADGASHGSGPVGGGPRWAKVAGDKKDPGKDAAAGVAIAGAPWG